MFAFVWEFISGFGDFIKINWEDGTINIIFFLLIIAVFVMSLIIKTGVIELIFSFILGCIVLFLRFCTWIMKSVCKLLLYTYSLTMFCCYIKKNGLIFSEYLITGFVYSVFGVRVINISGGNHLFIPYPKWIVISIKVFRRINYYTSVIFYNICYLFKLR